MDIKRANAAKGLETFRYPNRDQEESTTSLYYNDSVSGEASKSMGSMGESLPMKPVVQARMGPPTSAGHIMEGGNSMSLPIKTNSTMNSRSGPVKSVLEKEDETSVESNISVRRRTSTAAMESDEQEEEDK